MVIPNLQARSSEEASCSNKKESQHMIQPTDDFLIAYTRARIGSINCRTNERTKETRHELRTILLLLLVTTR
jgi:hypothetical protein